MGFELDEEHHSYIGHFENYYTSISGKATINSGDFLSISVFFEPENYSDDILNQLVENYELNVHNDICWLSISVPILFKKIKEKRFKEELIAFIEDLKNKNIKPLLVE